MEPRRVYQRPGSWLSLLLTLLPKGAYVCALLALPLSGLALWEYLRETHWTRNAITVAAELVDAEIRPIDGVDEHFLTYAYRVKGRPHRTEREVGPRTYARHPIGSTDTLYVLPGHPTKVRLVLGVGFAAGAFVQTAATLMWLPTLALFGVGAMRAARAVNVRRFGDRVPAEIVEIRAALPQDRAPGGKRLVWLTQAGRFGTSLPLSGRKAEQFRPGDTIRVYIGPDRDWWEGDLGPRSTRDTGIPAVARPPDGN